MRGLLAIAVVLAGCAGDRDEDPFGNSSPSSTLGGSGVDDSGAGTGGGVDDDGPGPGEDDGPSSDSTPRSRTQVPSR